MSFFTIEGKDESTAKEAVRRQYGDKAQILATKELSTGGFLGLFTQRRVEITGYVKQTRLVSEREKSIVETNNESQGMLKTLIKELGELKEKIDSGPGMQVTMQGHHETLQHIEQVLQQNDFSFSYTDTIIQRLTRTCTLEQLDNTEEVEKLVLQWIAESISVTNLQADKKSRIFILVGPTGVGKTTTIPKLSAMHGVLAKDQKNVRIITLDNYRIGAREQIAIYGDIMNIPTTSVETKDEFSRELKKSKDADCIFVDTVGRGPLDFSHLAEMRTFLQDIIQQATVILCISTTTKVNDMQEIIRQFDAFAPSAVILTKLDETQYVGNVISTLSTYDKPLCYFSTGQKVPQDIELASIRPLLTRISGFSVQKDDIMSIVEEKTE